MSECLPIETLEERAAGVLSAELEDHVAGCARCRERLEQIRANDVILRELLSSDPERVEAALAPAAAVQAAPADLARGYEIVGEIQRGGQGIVYRAVQKSTKRTVALKTLHADHSAAPRRQRRFEREIELVAGLRHPNIVTLHESGVTSDGRLYFVMEHIEGLPLDRYLRRAAGREREGAGSEGVEVVLRLFVKICAGVEYAHRRGVIHRDLKPGNILVDGEGEPHILDFGLAKVTDSEVRSLDVHVTRPGEFMGTFAYAAPEQVQGDPEQISTRTDVYALGVILYEMLTGQHPYALGGSLAEAVRAVVEAEPERPSRHNRRVGDEVETIVLKCLAKEPDRRYQSVEAVRQDVEHFLAGEPIEAKRDSTWYVLAKTARRHKGAVGAALGFVVLVTGAAVVMAVLAHRAGEERNRANENAAQLGAALEESRIERGRMAGSAGKTALAESLLWQVHVGRHAGGATNIAEASLGGFSGSPTHWALWELYARQPCLRSWSAHEDSVSSLCFSAHGGLLASAARDGTIRVWRSESGEPLRALDSQSAAVWSIRFHPEGAVLASGDADGLVRIWNVNDGRCLATLTGHEGAVKHVSFSADGRVLASSGLDRSIRLWSADRGYSTGGAIVHQGAVQALSVDPTGSLVATVNDEATLRVWRIASAELLVERVLGPVGRVKVECRVKFDRAGGRLVTSYHNEISVWDTATWGQPLQSVGAHREAINEICMTPDGRKMATASIEGIIKLWRLEPGGLELEASLAGRRGFASSLDFGADGRILAAGGNEGTISLWETAPTRCASRLADTDFSVHGAEFSRDGRWLAICGGSENIEPRLRVWDTRTWELKYQEASHADVMTCVAFHPDGHTLFTAGLDSTVWQLDIESGVVEWLGSMEREVSSIAVSPDGNLLACASNVEDGVVKLWNLAGRQWEREFREHTDRVAQVRFSPDGRWLASCSRDRTVVLRDLRSGRAGRPLEHDEGARSLCFHPEGKLIATGGDDGVIRLWEVETQTLVRQWEGHTQQVFDVQYRPDGKVLASASRGGEIRLWDGTTGRFLAALQGHEAMVFALSFHPDGRSMVSGGSGADVTKVWDLSYYDRHIAGNLEYQIGRMPPGTADEAAVERLRAWAAGVAAGAGR